MQQNLNLSVSTKDETQNLTILRITSAAKSSITEFYPDRNQLSVKSIDEVNKKITEKLSLHNIREIKIEISIQFESHRTATFTSLEEFKRFDLNTDALTKVVTIKWSFIFQTSNDDNNHLHSIYLRISEHPNPGLIFQKVFSGHSDDIDSLDVEAFSPIVCKVDFIDSRFSVEILSLITEWVNSLPKAEHMFGFMNWINKNENQLSSIIKGTFPAVMVLGYIGIWLGILPISISNSTRYATAWMLGGGAVYLLARYISNNLTSSFRKQIHRACNVPVFDITAGDGNRITRCMSKSKKSMIGLVAEAVIYGIFKGVGIYLSGYIVKAFIE